MALVVHDEDAAGTAFDDRIRHRLAARARYAFALRRAMAAVHKMVRRIWTPGREIGATHQPVVTLSRSDSVLSGVARSPDGEGRKLESYGTNGSNTEAYVGCGSRAMAGVTKSSGQSDRLEFTQL